MKINIYHSLRLLSNFLRLTTPFLIFVNPIVAILINIPLDGMDGFICNRSRVNFASYQKTDKLLDLYWYTFIIIWSVLNISPSLFFSFLIFFYFFRLTGEIIFFIRKNRKVFLFFPNIFEALFWFYFLVGFLNYQEIIQSPRLWLFLLIIAIGKEIQEILAHYYNFSSFNFIFRKKVVNWVK